MNILVTGGCGFLGSAISKKLINRGFNVKVFDKPGCSVQLQKEFGVEIIEGDIRDFEVVRKAIKGNDIVFHVAALLSFEPKMRKIQEEVNVTGTRNVMSACLSENVKKVIHTSTVNAIGFSFHKEVLDESADFNWKPYNLGYMNTKYEAEKIILEMVKDENLPAVIVNPGTIFGKSDFSLLNANSYIINIAKMKVPFYPSGGTNCVAVDDVAEGHILAMEKGKFGERYILGGENYTYKDLFHLIANELKVIPPLFPIKKEFGFLAAETLEIISLFSGKNAIITKEMITASSYNSFFSSDKAKNELGYEFKPFIEILKDTIFFLKESKQI